MEAQSNPLSHATGGGSRGWRRHVRHWKSAHTLAKTGNKVARNWLTKHGKPVPAHPNDRRTQEPTVLWDLLPLGYSSLNWCPQCYADASQKEVQAAKYGRKSVLVCRSCLTMFRPR